MHQKQYGNLCRWARVQKSQLGKCSFKLYCHVLQLVVVSCWLIPSFAAQDTSTDQNQSVQLYDDPRVVAWARAYIEGEEDSVLQSVEKDLRSVEPHPFAASIWTIIHGRHKRLAQVWNQLQDPQLRDAIGVLPKITLLRAQHRHLEVLEEYPPESAGEITDVSALIKLAGSAGVLARRTDKFAYLLAAGHLYPMYFQIALMFEDVLSSNVLRNRAAVEVRPDGALHGTPLGVYLTSFLAIRPWTVVDYIASTDRWLSDYPSDARAMVARGILLDRQRYDQAAADTYLKALEAFPFNPASANYAAVTPLLRLDKEAEARLLLQRVGVWYEPNPERLEVWVARRLAQALRETGNKGRSRQVLETALQRWPKDETLLAEQTQLEIADNRKEEAVIYARRAWEHAPDDLDNRIWFMETLQQAGELQEALEVFKEFDTTSSFRPQNFYVVGSRILGTLQSHESRIALMERALKDYPDSTWMHGHYAEVLKEAGRPQEALSKLRRALELDPSYSWAAQQMVQYISAAEGEQAADEKTKEFIRTHPWQRDFWELRNTRFVGKNAKEQQLELWREAMQQNPSRVWPVDAMVRILIDEERWREALQAVGILFKTEPVSADDRIERFWLRAYVAREWATHETIDSAILDQALADLEEFKDGYGWLASYYSNRQSLLRSVSRNVEAARAQLAHAELVPDDIDAFGNLIREYTKQLGAGKLFGRGAAIVERNPYDGSKLLQVSRWHIMWGGSPIIGLRIIHHIKERGLLESHEYYWLEGMALGQLGDSVRDFEARYQSTDNISGSDRYIKWYEDSRRKVLNHDRRIVNIDYAAELPTAEIILPNREIARRVDHPISGRIMSLSRGAAFVRAEYDDRGANLLSISASSGAWVRLKYDGSNRIIQLITSQGKELRFVLGVVGKPIEIHIKGTGAIRMEYDGGGKLISVKPIADDGEGNADSLSSQVLESMNELMGLVNLLEQSTYDVPSLPYQDDLRDTLRERYEWLRWSDEDGKWVDAGLGLARYLVEQLDADAKYAGEAREVLSDVIEATQDGNDAAVRMKTGEAIMLWHRLARATKPKGLPGDEFSQWSALREWLRDEATSGGDSRFADWFAKVDNDKERLVLFPDDRWLPGSDLQNSGFWRRYGYNRLFPKTTKEPRAVVALVRRNGDVVVGSSIGLSVLRRGFWEWFGFNYRTGRFSANTGPDSLSISSEVLSLAETDDDVLWIGTAKGLYAVEDGYEGRVRRWHTVEEGLPSPRVEHLLSRGTVALVGTDRGLLSATLAGISSAQPMFSDIQIRLLATAGHHDAAAERPQALSEASVPVLVGTDTALYVITAGNERLQVTPWPVDDAVWSPSLSQIVVLRGTDVYTISGKGEGVWGEPRSIPGQQDLRYSKEVYGLAVLHVPDVGETVAALTDEGLSLYRDSHFEFMPLPLEQQRLGLGVGPRKVASRNGDMHFLTHEGLYSFERGHVRWEKGSRVFDIVTDQDLGRIYIARGNSIEVVDENDPNLKLYRLGWYAARHLGLDNKGRLIANDGHTIIRLDRDSNMAQELFDAKPTVTTTSEKYGNGPVRDLFVASDGTIWVASGGSVFRWREGKSEEFSFFLEPRRFPSRTDMISRVVETIDGKIWAIASNEGHRSHRGINLEGGLLEWTGEAFRRIRKPSFYRMITGYTQIDDGTAIVGTTSGFVRHTKDGHFQPFFGMKDASYKQLRERTPLLWLGRKGAQVEQQSWLFPSAGGILLYHKGRWRYPERLNQMLPDDQKLGQYGGRTTHAMAVDSRGRIYAGTDRGLLIYEAGGSVESLLIDNGLSNEAFDDFAVERLQKLGEIMLNKIDPDGSEQGRILARFRKAEQEINELRVALAEGDSSIDGEGLQNKAPSNIVGDTPQKPTAGSTFRQRLEQREKERHRLLYQLENEHYGLFQMLELNPHDLTALHKELPAGQAVVQYLPTPQKLFIQLVTHKGTQIREVNVEEQELYRRAQLAAAQLALDAKRLDEIRAGKSLLSDSEEVHLDLTSELAWLYDQLLRPVERELAGMDHVFVVPVGKLTYLPFAALVYMEEERPKYAVERFAMGALPSLFHLRLILQQRKSYSEESLVIGDPDGSLPGARQEVQEVSATLSAPLPPLIGTDATIENFLRQAPNSRIVHLATHGVLNHERPAESYLLMANGYRLNVVDISMLDLKETDLVVLSACESGIGRDGLEYATLARAFAHAKVPSVVASLWLVSDSATRHLMLNFYSNFVRNGDVFFAMADAQRALIQGDEAWRHPAAWSGFVVFGKP